MAKKLIPKFKSEDEERAFWAKNDAVDYFDELDFEPAFPNLRPSTEVISLRLPKELLDRIKTEAYRRDIPYQSYMKVKLDEVFGRPARL